MITIDDKEYRNLQEQVGYLTEELKKLKQSLGSALPEPIEGPQGPQGETGATGPQGRSPKIGFGFGPLPTDDSFQNGDVYIIRGNNPQYGLTKGSMYRKVNGNWQLQLNLVGPQGPQGPLHESNVIANPEDEASSVLEKLDIEGVVYTVSYVEQYSGSDNPYTFYGLEAVTINGNNYFVGGVWAKYLSSILYWDEENMNVVCNEDAQFDEDIYLTAGKIIHGGSSYGSEVELGGAYYLSGSICLDGIEQIIDEDNNPIIVCENLTDKNNYKRFVEGKCSINNSNFSGTIDYNKWSLSGTHLMIVIAGTINAGSYSTSDLFYLSSPDIPSWILDKIVPTSGNYIDFYTLKIWVSWVTTNFSLEIKKGSYLSIAPSHAQTVEQDSKFRLKLDFLIDME